MPMYILFYGFTTIYVLPNLLPIKTIHILLLSQATLSINFFHPVVPKSIHLLRSPLTSKCNHRQ